jgi:hypothetical protein
VYLVKTNSVGHELWHKTFGGSDIDIGYSVQQTTDGGYIIAGETWSFGKGMSDVFIIKTDSEGKSIWSKALGGSDIDIGYSVQQTTDGGYIIAGKTYSRESYDVYLIKIDSEGNKKWEETLGSLEHDSGWAVQQTSDGGYVIVGYTNSLGEGATNIDAYLIKTDSEGKKMWGETFGGSGYDEFIFVQQTTDGGYIMVGDTRARADIMELGVSDIYLVKTDSEGNEIWNKTFGGINNDFGYSIQETNDGGYIMVGETDSFVELDWDVYLIKIDSDGNEVWSKTFGGSDDDTGWSVKQTTDGGYIIVGETWDDYMEDVDVYLIKLAPEGEPIPETTSPSPTPSPTPRALRGIPSFPMWSIVVALVLYSLILHKWFF